MSDLIKRQDAIDAFRYALSEVGILDSEDVEKVFKLIPSAQPEVIACGEGELKSESQWIPCSERLPEVSEYIGDVCKYYLIQDEYGDMQVAHYSRVGWIPIHSLKAIGDEVVAWMPLPEPYQYPLDIRDCDHCKHYVTRDGQTGCEKWDCEFEKGE